MSTLVPVCATATLDVLVDALAGRRFRAVDEYAIQDAMASAFAEAGLSVAREVRLSGRDRVDFLAGGVVIEVKIQGSRVAIWRQLQRYAAHPDVEAVVLATTRRSLLVDLPEVLSGVPVVGLLLRGPSL